MVKCDALIGIQDMGAAGLTSSSAEMASKAGSGIEMNLDLVPQRETGMTPYEMMLSESQERMLLVVEKGREDEIKAIFEHWNLHAVEVGVVTDDRRLRLLHNGEVVADVPVDALAEDAPVYHKPSRCQLILRNFKQKHHLYQLFLMQKKRLFTCLHNQRLQAKSGFTSSMIIWCRRIRLCRLDQMLRL